MRGAAHHAAVVLRLLGTTRGGLIAMLVLVNCVPMAGMSTFTSGPRPFAHGFALVPFVASLLFAPLCRWTLGYTLGWHRDRSTAAFLPLSPRVRAVSETAATLAALWVVFAAVLGLAVLALGTSGLDEWLPPFAQVCASVSALALPHLLLASLDREAPARPRLWIRWLAAPTLLGLGLLLPGSRSFVGHLAVGLTAGAIILAWGPASWLRGAPRRKALGPALDARTVAREAPGDPHTTLRLDFRRGLGVGATRGLLWATVLMGPLIALRWWRFPEISAALVVATIAIVAAGFPLGLRARVVGGRWAHNGDFRRAWSVLPIPTRSLNRAVYLHIAACSAVALALPALALMLARSPGTEAILTTGLLFAMVVVLSLVGIRTHAAVGTRRLWQFSWLAGSTAVGCLWLSRFALDAPKYAAASTGLTTLALLAAVAVALSPATALRTE